MKTNITSNTWMNLWVLAINYWPQHGNVTMYVWIKLTDIARKLSLFLGQFVIAMVYSYHSLKNFQVGKNWKFGGKKAICQILFTNYSIIASGLVSYTCSSSPIFTLQLPLAWINPFANVLPLQNIPLCGTTIVTQINW